MLHIRNRVTGILLALLMVLAVACGPTGPAPGGTGTGEQGVNTPAASEPTATTATTGGDATATTGTTGAEPTGTAAETGGTGGGTTAGGYPNKAIEIMAPANPGGGWDITSRTIAQVLQDAKIVPVAVEVFNKPGAGGTVGLGELVNARKGDPYTLMVMGRVMLGAIITNKSEVTLEGVTPLARLTSENEVVVVPAESPYKTMQDLVTALKADPKSIAWAGGSAGGTDHILVGQIAQAVGVDPSQVNYVPFSGGGEAIAAILGNQVTAGVSGYGEWEGQITAGKMRALAVSGDKRIEGVDIPTLQEAGVDVVLLNWRGIVAPPGIGDEEREYLIDMLTRMHSSQQWQDVLKQNKWDDVFMTEGFDTYIVEENESLEEILTAIGLVK